MILVEPSKRYNYIIYFSGLWIYTRFNKNGYIFAVATNTSNGRIYLDKYDSSLNFLERNTWKIQAQVL